ncbi:hypothetical protein LJB96_04850, partial [Methanobrevibacter sp. OttesenSCG-928-K11]|nr:hypothetical protein [Methanobrevibacter sp. OttesenSCG-928-K11]
DNDFFKKEIENFDIDSYLSKSENKCIQRGFLQFFLNLDDYNNLCDKFNISVSDLFLSAIGYSLSEFLNNSEVLLFNTFGGRNNPKYFDVMGYFPIGIPITLNTQEKSYLDYVKHKVISSMENYSPFSDIKGLRYLNNDILKDENSLNAINSRHISPFIVYNYMEAFGGDHSNNKYVINNFRGNNFETDEDTCFLIPNLEFSCFSRGNQIALFIEFDTSLCNNEDGEILFKNIDKFLRKLSDDVL